VVVHSVWVLVVGLLPLLLSLCFSTLLFLVAVLMLTF
jgi:hypothetical protein